MTGREKKCLKFVSELLEMYEFDLYATKWVEEEWIVFKVKDLQGWNLWNIEDDEFLNLWQVISRMNVYHQDYIYNAIDEWDYWDDDAWINEYAMWLESERVRETLEDITPEKITQDICENYFISYKW